MIRGINFYIEKANAGKPGSAPLPHTLDSRSRIAVRNKLRGSDNEVCHNRDCESRQVGTRKDGGGMNNKNGLLRTLAMTRARDL